MILVETIRYVLFLIFVTLGIKTTLLNAFYTFYVIIIYLFLTVHFFLVYLKKKYYWKVYEFHNYVPNTNLLLYLIDNNWIFLCMNC